MRKQNQDAYANHQDDRYFLAVLCDGMGGHVGGEVASKMACSHILEFIQKNFSTQDISGLMTDAILYANDAIRREAQRDEHYHNMGTTAVCAMVIGDVFHIAHVGDSRCYRYNGRLTQLTEDHSLVNDLLKSGSITEEEARHFLARNSITRAVGIEEWVKVDTIAVEIEAGDLFLLCTDGLSGYIEDEEIADVLKQPITLGEKAEMLVYLANASGGRDNITVTLIQPEEGL